MSELELFQLLKLRILETYQKSYPYFQGDWKSFSSKDIRQLMDLVENELNERVSEKWIYTHLKPETNDKLPRKDMLDIFVRFVGDNDWREFVFKNSPKENQETESQKKVPINAFRILLFIPILVVGIVLGIVNYLDKPHKIEIVNAYTSEPISNEEIQVYTVSDGEKKYLEIENSQIEISAKDEKVHIESPFFENKEIQLSESTKEIMVQPEDYALVLKSFIESDLNDWSIRKEKLAKILSDDLEVIILMKDNLGAEHLNKKEFSEKLIIPTDEIKRMKIIHLETNPTKEITFIRIQKL